MFVYVFHKACVKVVSGYMYTLQEFGMGCGSDYKEAVQDSGFEMAD